jgi:hypothetical protein
MKKRRPPTNCADARSSFEAKCKGENSINNGCDARASGATAIQVRRKAMTREEIKKKFKTITKKGVLYVMKVCVECGDEWYANLRQTRCTLCGSGLRRVLKGENILEARDVQEGMTRGNRKMLAKIGITPESFACR